MKRKYIPQPADTSDIQLSPELIELSEIIARDVHDTWALGRMREGWIYGPILDNQLKTHPCLVPYEELPETEKDYDRNTATATLQFVIAAGFEIKKE